MSKNDTYSTFSEFISDFKEEKLKFSVTSEEFSNFLKRLNIVQLQELFYVDVVLAEARKIKLQQLKSEIITIEQKAEKILASSQPV